MSKILTITWKELYTTFRDRNLILIMFLTPIVLSTIMGLVFGGLGSGSGSTSFADMPIAVVNLDEGFNLADQIPSDDGEMPSLDDLEFAIGGQTINLGEQLRLNPNLTVSDTPLQASNASFNLGDTLAGMLLSESVTATTATTATTGLDFNALTCPLVETSTADSGFSGTLDNLFAAVKVDDAAVARAAVDRGDYVAAVIIPAGFSTGLMPSFALADPVTNTVTNPQEGAAAVEVYANAGRPISASIVRAVVEGIVNQLQRTSVALDSMLAVSVDRLLAAFNVNSLTNLNLSSLDPTLLTNGIQSLDASILDPLACLMTPGAGNITLHQEPLDPLQTQSSFAFIMILLGSAQAIFFAMFTGIFGINSIYAEQDNWTLQRLVASPTPRSFILAGKLLGNLVVVTAQLVILLTSFTVIASIVEGKPSFIWGTNIPALLAVIVGIALFVSGLGVLVVGLAKNSAQVQFFGPMVASTMGALGGSFGFRLPPSIAGLSPVWWGSEALRRVSTGEIDTLATPLLVLFGVGIGTFIIGTMLFRRRLDL